MLKAQLLLLKRTPSILLISPERKSLLLDPVLGDDVQVDPDGAKLSGFPDLKDSYPSPVWISRSAAEMKTSWIILMAFSMLIGFLSTFSMFMSPTWLSSSGCRRETADPPAR